MVVHPLPNHLATGRGQLSSSAHTQGGDYAFTARPRRMVWRSSPAAE